MLMCPSFITRNFLSLSRSFIGSHSSTAFHDYQHRLNATRTQGDDEACRAREKARIRVIGQRSFLACSRARLPHHLIANEQC